MKKFTIFVGIIDVLVAACFILVYLVPSVKIKVISTAMITKTHQYIAYIFYSEDTVNEIVNANRYIPLTDEVNLDEIVIDTKEKDSYENEYDEEILKRDPGNEDYKYIKVKVGKYDGHLVAIYDPSKVKLISSKSFNTGKGQERIKDMCKRHNGLVCINGGRFNDTTGYGSDIPKGTLIKDGKIIWSDTSQSTNLIGFNKDNKLVLTDATAKEAIDMGIRDALQFGPFLIVNGKKLQYESRAGGYDRAARVAIAQRRDGVVLFLVTEGVHTSGPSLKEVIEVLDRYGAYNAANLDGGTSAQLVIENKLINTPKTIYGKKVSEGRRVVSGFGLLEE
ncbi:MAG: phosphodiester glycosidase family protein [Bacilli bacterium]|nr:phosphodiester glycosidase family protein [Bacilli bacterium]